MGRHKSTGFVVEDRGAVGIRGRRLYRIEIPQEPHDPLMLVVPEEELIPLTEEDLAPTVLDKDKILKYLRYGLCSILSENLEGGKYQPRIWLLLNSLGNITYTLRPELGVLGGAIPPSGAVRGSKIFRPKKDEVLAFLASFGLDPQEAKTLVSQVGTAP